MATDSRQAVAKSVSAPPRYNLLRGRPWLQVCGGFFLLALALLPFADLKVYPSEPGQELLRIALGVITPNWYDWPALGQALLQTVSFALIAVVISVVVGFGLALIFHARSVRVFCASIRAVHELFWALILMQVFGLSATTGVLAIAIPYAGIFAKVFAEILEQQAPLPQHALAPSSSLLSRWLYTRLPQAWPQIVAYTRYRFECALRSSTILGFIGLPTLGFYFETAFKQGQYSQAACLLWALFALIASLRYWLHAKLIPLYVIVAFWLLPESAPVNGQYFWQFISHDIWPRTLQQGLLWETVQWYGSQLWTTLLPAAGYTLVLSLIALVLTGILATLIYPIASRPLAGRGAFIGHGALLMLRSTPEMVLAFVLLLVCGPSALPALLALAIHNSGLIGYLVARASDELPQRIDACRGFNLYSYQITPQIFPYLLTLLLYRWEVIMRETAILGILGVTTLGFYVDSAFAEIRYDKALLLVVVAALLNIAVDFFARQTRRYCGLSESRAVFSELKLKR